MKRVLLFLAIFGAGFIVLWTFRTKTPQRDRPAEVSNEPKKPGQFSQIEIPSSKKDNTKSQIQVEFDGPIDYTNRKDTGDPSNLRPQYELHTTDVDQLSQNVLDMHDLRVTVYDPATGKKRADLESPLSRVKITIDKGSARLSDTEPVQLANVDLTLYEGGPVVPLHLKIPKLEWNVADTSFTSSDRVRITGTGLEADGSGLNAKTSTSSFELLRDASIRLVLSEGHVLTLTSGPAGSISVRKIVENGAEFIDLQAQDSARFVVDGVQPLEIRGQTIHMLGRRTDAAAQNFEIVRADAHGDVNAASRGDTFKAQDARFKFAPGGKLDHLTLDRAVELSDGTDAFFADHSEFEFDAKGDLAKATLTGTPHGQVEVGRFLVKERPELGAARADIEGAGPLVVTRDAGDHVDLAGPAKFTLADLGLVLNARDRIVGYDDSATKTGTMTATGAVVLDYGANKLTCDVLDLDWALVKDQPTVHARAQGVTTLNGTSSDGRKGTTVARGGLEAIATKEKLVVTEAREVEITSLEPDGAHAKAQVVRAFDWDTRKFEAEGDVTFDSVRGNGAALRVVAEGPNEMRMYGSENSPAHYEFARATSEPTRALQSGVWATEIKAFPDHVEARGNVKSFVETLENRLDLDSGALELTVQPEDSVPAGTPRKFDAHASEGVTAKIARANDKAFVTSDDLVVNGRVLVDPNATSKVSVTSTNVRATKNVHLDYAGAGTIVGDGDTFTLDEFGLGRLSAEAHAKVKAKGRFAGTQLPYAIEADWVEFDRESVQAENVRVLLEGAAIAVNSNEPSQSDEQFGPGAAPAILHELRAHKIRADEGEISLVGDAHIEGITQRDEAWTIDAASIRMRGDFKDAKKIEKEKITSLDAEGGFHAQLGDRLEMSGETLHGVPERIRVEGSPALMNLLDAEWQSAWIQYDTKNMLLSTDKGSVRARVGSPGLSWSADYESMQPFEQDGRTILVLRNPRLRLGPNQLFAEWTLFWVDRNEWKKSGHKTVSDTMKGAELHVDTPPEVKPKPKPGAQARAPKSPLAMLEQLSQLRQNPLFKVLSEVYVEGNIEVFDEGERMARASAMYLDVVETQGWIQDADVSIDIDVRGFRQRIRAKAAWMRISPGTSGPSVRAQNAEITACDFDQPHYVIETGDLRITPRQNASDERVAWGISADDNKLRFENGIQIPFPSFAPDLNEEGRPLIDRLVLGNSAKYGAAVRATVNAELGPIGKGIGKGIAAAIKIPEVDIRGNWHYNLGILGSRGVLLGMGLDLTAADKFRLETDFDGIPDRGNDKGLVRVDEDDRSLIRTWFRARARYTIRDGEWVDLAFSRQSDPGVQSEFFERDYLRYEQKDNYLHWRKAKNEWYFNASAKVRLDDRRDVDELPSAGAYLGRSQIGTAFENPIYFVGNVDAGYFRRRDGDPRYYSPFEDGLGDRNIHRVDTEQRIEVPFSLGFLAARGTPYVSTRATLWDEGADPDSSPARVALIAGFDATTTFWRRYPGGSVHTITPTIGVHGDLASQASNDELVHIDTVEDPIEGRFVDVGVRSRWWMPDTRERLDIDLRASHGSNLPDGQTSGVQPISMLADYLTYYGNVPVGFTQDGRYDTRTGNTIYSLSSLGIEPWESVGLEFGYTRGLSTVDEERLFESASISARWRWTTKWELEAGQSYAIADDTGVGNRFTLRRLGHDFVTEFDFSYRSEEGSTFSIGFQPRISWKRSGLGLLDRWLGAYH